jgi:DNA helicase II / ATP-dependent DNA helicase PcrA
MEVFIIQNEQILTRILNEPNKLSDNQREAVLSSSKFVRVIAGAGAGKTETLTRRIVYLLLIKNIKPSDLVAFTFTERAAQNMKSRVYQRIMQLGREDIAKRMGEMYIGTIHGFCLRILEDYFGYGNYGVLDENQEMAFLLRHGWGLGLHTGGFYTKSCEEFLNTINVIYSEQMEREKLKKHAPDFHEKLIKYEQILDDHKRLTFGRMIYEAVLRIQEHPEKLPKIQHLIVDEFQDIDNAQFQLIKLIGSHAQVFVVGDPRQSIYQWRGSNERFFLDFLKQFQDTHPVEIKENRRSAKKIVHVSNKFADCFDDVKYEHLDAIRNHDGEITKLRFEDEDEEAVWVVDQIEQLVKKNGCKFSDFGILMRSVKTSAEPLIQEFKDRRIPYIVGGKVGLFKRDEAQALGRLLSWVVEDGFWVENPYAWNTRITGDDLLTSGISLWQNAVNFQLPKDIDERLSRWKIDILIEKYSNFKIVYYELLSLLGYHKFEITNNLHQACMANLGRFSSLIQDFEVAMRFEEKSHKWKTEMKNLCWFMNTYAVKSYEEQNVDDIRKVNAVQIMTVHQAKGLEWPVVFLPALIKKRFPSSFAGRERSWHIPRDLFDAERYEGGIEEEKRLFYVAITRARDVLIPSFFKKYKSESQCEFLDILDDFLEDDYQDKGYKLEYTPKEKVEEEEIQTYSTTELIDYMRCPHHYRLYKLWEYIQDISPFMGYGETLHFCLRHASDLIKKERYSPVSAIATAIDEKFFLPFAGGELNEKLKANARKALISFAKKYERDMHNILEVETRLEFPLQNAMLMGKVDVILKDKDSYEIRDYKTSDKVITDADSALQIRLYSLGLRELGWKIDDGSVAYLENGIVDHVTVNDDEVRRAKNVAQSAINNIKAGCYDPKPSSFCKDCEYKVICKWKKDM